MATVKTVALVLPDRVAPFEFGVAAEIFGAPQRGEDWPRFDFRICTDDPSTPVPLVGAGSITASHDLTAVADADVVIVPAAPRTPTPATVSDDALAALRAAVDRDAWVVSLCTGAFVLAQAGILDGRRATTHWRWADSLAAAYPSIDVDPDVLYVQDGTVITSAGTAAGVDACLHLLRTTHGPRTAGVVARQLVMAPHREGGQRQFVHAALPEPRGDGLGELLAWVRDHLEQEHTLGSLAARAGWSQRTLVRRFAEQTGTTAGRWIAGQRVLRAQELLEGTGLSVEQVAREVGFGTAALLRHHFTREVGATPAAYRRRFGEPAAAG
jgi:transcriptional regulator GlxA family with amidase domain